MLPCSLRKLISPSKEKDPDKSLWPDLLDVSDGVVVVLYEVEHVAGAVPRVAAQVHLHPGAAPRKSQVTNTSHIVALQAQLQQGVGSDEFLHFRISILVVKPEMNQSDKFLV